jgi:transposase
MTLKEEVVFYPLTDCTCPKCGDSNLKEINSFEESSEIDVIPAQNIIRRHKRHKYSCLNCKNIITAKGGVKLTPSGEYSIQMATQITCDKFEDHLPLERQRKQMERVGL